MRRDPRSTTLVQPPDVEAALDAHASPATPYLAGGTTLVDLVQLGHAPPERFVHLGKLDGPFTAVRVDEEAFVLGAGVRMADAARHPALASLPALIDALRMAASPQIREMATLGGNVLQRTRCPYFRDPHARCHKREPGSGCDAIGGETRGLAILGTSEWCIANYAGDLAVALVALQGQIETRTRSGETRTRPVAGLHRRPGQTPWHETELEEGELITALRVPRVAGRRSVFVKARDRASYAFALASCAAAVTLDDAGRVEDATLALGGLATVPWPCPEADAFLVGRTLDADTAAEAARLCLLDRVTDPRRSFAVELGRRVVQRAVMDLRVGA
ncbi:MAG: FAD binding domain-containing protein [Myxococcota bacterium]